MAVERQTVDPEVLEGAARGPTAPRGPVLVADPSARGHAAVLARPRQPGALDPVRAAQALVAAVPEGLRWHWLLARGVLHAGRDRRDLQRRGQADRHSAVRSHAAGARRHVLG